MNHSVTLNISAEMMKRVKAVAAQSDQSVETVLLHCINQSLAVLPVDMLPDDEVLAICHSEINPALLDELRKMKVMARSRSLTHAQEIRMSELKDEYRHKIERKAEAEYVARQRGLVVGN